MMQVSVREMCPNRKIFSHPCIIQPEGTLQNFSKYESCNKQSRETCELHTRERFEAQTIHIPATRFGC
jgi:hypothetical protein